MGSTVERSLWASTSTKDPAYPDTLYLDNLIGPQTVNTAPPHTIEAFRDHGTLAPSLEADIPGAVEVMDELDRFGIDMHEMTDQLLREGVDKFEKPYRSLLNAIEQKCAEFTKTPSA